MLNISLEISRGLASLAVFLFHIKGAESVQTSPILLEIARYGYLGVPLFFIISGYCMMASSKNTIKTNRSASYFLKRRFFRIYIPFWASIIVVLVVPFIIEGVSSLKYGEYQWPKLSWESFGWSDWFQLATLTRIFFNENGDIVGAFSPVNGVYWSLAIEFQFYLVMAFSIKLKKYFNHVIITITVLSLFSLFLQEIIDTGLFLSYWPSFALGLGLYSILEKGISFNRLPDKVRNFYSILVVFSLMAPLLFLFMFKKFGTLVEMFPKNSDFIFALYCSILFWSLSSIEPLLEKAKLSHKYTLGFLINSGVFLGSISYSLYLLHTKIYEIPGMIARQFIPQSSLFNLAFTMVGTIPIVYVFYYFFERLSMPKKIPKTQQKSVNKLMGRTENSSAVI